MNPWKTIWLQPRMTVRYFLEEGNPKHPLYIVLLMGFLSFLTTALMNAGEEPMSYFGTIIGALIGGTISSFISWWISAGLIYFVAAKILGGVGTYKQTRFAYAYGLLPLVMGQLVLWFPTAIILGNKAFADPVFLSSFQTGWVVFFTFVYIILSIWSFVTMLNAVSEAHQFSRWRGFFSVILPGILVFMFFVSLIMLIMTILIF